MRAVIVLLAVAACDPEFVARPDACALPSGVQPGSWRWAVERYGEAWCSTFSRCDSAAFVATYGDAAECAADVAARCDAAYGRATCDATYPDGRLPALTQCEAEEAQLACSATDAPDSCYAALAAP